MATKIVPGFFEFGDKAIVVQRVTVLNQYTDEDGITEVLLTEQGEFRSDEDLLVVVYHDPEED